MIELKWVEKGIENTLRYRYKQLKSTDSINTYRGYWHWSDWSEWLEVPIEIIGGENND